MLRSLIRIHTTECRSVINNFRSQMNLFLDSTFGSNFPQLALAGINQVPKAEEEPSESVLSNWIWFAAPKSKISPSRKRQKHMRFFPEKVAWVKCEKCGEPKRPHRICTDHIDICAMKPKEYGEFLAKEMAKQAGNS